MKKYLFFALAAVGLLASCNKNKVEVGNPYDQVLDQGITTPELIQLGAITTDVNVETKGSGMIEEWAEGGSTIKVIGVVEDAAVTDLDHKTLTANADGTVNGLDNVYYESGQLYKFYGYYVDNATVEGTPSGTADVTIKIDGTQDIMAAVTDPASDFQVALRNWKVENADATDIRGLTETNLATYAYSDKTARRGMVPNLTFHHLLSAMKFHFVHGQGESGISITGLSLKACVDGTVKVVAEKAAQVATASRATDALTDADVMTFNPTSPVEIAQYGADETTLAGSAMIFPGATEVVLSLTYQKGENAAQTTSVTVKAPVGSEGGFLANTQYKVTISVYGKQAVVLNTTIEAWGEEVNIEIDDDDIQ